MLAGGPPVVALLDTPEFWSGLITAIIGVAFWFVALGVLYFVYERYLKDKDRPEMSDRPDT